MRLAWRNLLYDRLRFFVTIAGIAFSIVLMLFQGSLLMGLAGISTKLIEIASPDIWITARGVESFESSVSLPERDRQTALGVKGVSSVDRIVTGTAVWRSESGEQQTVFIIGADRGISPHFPLPYEGGAIIPESVLIDQSDRPLLEIDKTPTTVEISGARARVLKSIEGFGSIIGTPYVFTSYQDGVKYLNLGDETMLLLVKIADGANRETVRRQLRSRLPNVEVRTQTEFLQLARAFLLIQLLPEK